jgi:hypothetical protein
MQQRLRTDPEAVIYNALAETVSIGLLNLQSDILSEAEQMEDGGGSRPCANKPLQARLSLRS